MSNIKQGLGVVGWVVIGALAIGGLSIGGVYFKGYLSRIAESQRTLKFEQSVAYTQGNIRELARLETEYRGFVRDGDSIAIVGIKANVRDNYSHMDSTKLPNYLQNFLRDINLY